MFQKFNTLNDWLAIKITDAVSTMWCAYIFSIIALISLPDSIKGGVATTITWIAQTFLQLVLLSVILVANKIESKRTQSLMKSSSALLDSHEEIHDKLDELLSSTNENK